MDLVKIKKCHFDAGSQKITQYVNPLSPVIFSTFIIIKMITKHFQKR